MISNGSDGRRVRVLLVAALSIVLLTNPFGVRNRVLAELPFQAGLHILSPAEGSIVGDGNLVLVDVVATDRSGGVAERVEVAFDSEERWTLAQRDPDDPSRWRHVWTDGASGQHLVRVRAHGLRDQPSVEERAGFEINLELWSSAYVLDHPHGTPGLPLKGQLHTHSTFSFDGWASRHPGDLAVAYQRRGYQFVAITDHDVISNPREMNSDHFVAIPAFESTAESGHITALFASEVAATDLPPQERINHIRARGGMAVLNHPSWQVGWNGTDFRTLEGCFAFEVYNHLTDNPGRQARNLALWHDVLNAKGPGARIWAVAVDDAHTEEMDRGWIVLKAPALNEGAIRKGLENGAFYASSGPSFAVLGVMNGAIAASSPEASIIRFIDDRAQVVSEGPGQWAGYFATGAERWIRVEAAMADGRKAWSQPFWVLPNPAHAESALSRSAAAPGASGSIQETLIDLFRHPEPIDRTAHHLALSRTGVQAASR